MNTKQFLEKFRPGGPWVITAINVDPDAKPKTSTKEFSDLGLLDEWLIRQTNHNFYFVVNRCKKGISKKPSRDDVSSLDALHVDIDFKECNDDGGPVQEEYGRILNTLKNPPDGVPIPSCVVFSGGGFQAFWLLKYSQILEDNLQAKEEAALYSQKLEPIFGADSCSNVDRIMRLPGTMNKPTKTKIAKGRKSIMSGVEFFNENRFDLEDFAKGSTVKTTATKKKTTSLTLADLPKLKDVQQLDAHTTDGKELSYNVKSLIVNGEWDPDEDQPYWRKDKDNSDSGYLWAACCSMARAGIPKKYILAAITDEGFGISRSVFKQPNVEYYANRQANNAYEAVEKAEKEEKKSDKLGGNPTVKEAMDWMNSRYTFIRNVGGKARILQRTIDRLTGRAKIDYLADSAILSSFPVPFVTVQTKNAKGEPVDKAIPLGKFWLGHPTRNDCNGVMFYPEGNVEGMYNLWHGFGYEPKEGDCSLYLEHLADNVCSGDKVHFDYLIGWMARAVQHPDKPAGTAVVIQGEPGTGKSFFIGEFGSLFGTHYFPTPSSDSITGRFNSRLEDAVLLFADEAFNVGDKRSESALKTIITERTMSIEHKGLNIQTMANCVHLMMASNDDWVVPIGMKDRRFFVLKISEARRNDSKYFGMISAQMKSGGREALLYFLKNYDLSGFDFRKIPQTEALGEQKEHSFSNEDSWWLSVLERGRLLENDEGWTRQAETHSLSYACHLSSKKISLNPTNFGKFIKKKCGAAVKKRKLKGPIEVRLLDNQVTKIKYPTAFVFPTLEKCRKAWDKKTNIKRDWNNGVEEIQESPADPKDGGGEF